MYKDDHLLKTYQEFINPNNAAFLERLGLDTTVREARGAVIRDDRGRTFIDFLAGYGVFNLGHNPPRLISAMTEALAGTPLWNRPFLSEPLAGLTERLVELAPDGLDRVFICSTGAEAVESAIKLVRLAGRKKEIIAAEGAFHGFTLGALSASGIPPQTRPFRPLLPDFRHVPFGDASALEAAISEKTAAVLLEPVQAEIGGLEPPDGYLRAVREICDRAGILLMIDEVRTGIGRTGTLFAIEHEKIIPDVLILGKSLGGGIAPIGALLAKSSLWGRFGMSFSMSASSFAGNRLSCVSALAALSIMSEEDVLARGQAAADILWPRLTGLAGRHPDLIDRVTGRGLLAGLHFKNNRLCDRVIVLAIQKGLLIGAAFCNNRCVLIEPPLVIEPADVERALDILDEVMAEVSDETAGA